MAQARRPTAVVRLMLACLAFLHCCSAEQMLGTCGMEGEKCSVTRDCYAAHECIEGDWSAASSNSFCKRIGAKPSIEQYMDRLKSFFLAAKPDKYSNPDLLRLTLKKWAGREERLFHTLREKYPWVKLKHDEL